MTILEYKSEYNVQLEEVIVVRNKNPTEVDEESNIEIAEKQNLGGDHASLGDILCVSGTPTA